MLVTLVARTEKALSAQEEQSSLVLVSDSVEGKSVHDTKNAQKESSNNEPSTTDDVNSNKESVILVENKDDNQTKTDIELLDNGGKVSDVYILGSSNGNALIQEARPMINDQEWMAREAQNSGFLKSSSRNFEYLHHKIYAEVVELEALRIPSDEIKFGKK
ncbi:hypothetical protein Tco_1442968 [Tanacetum coccineum]